MEDYLASLDVEISAQETFLRATLEMEQSWDSNISHLISELDDAHVVGVDPMHAPP